MKTLLVAVLGVLWVPVAGHAQQSMQVQMFLIDEAGLGVDIGTVTATETRYGTLFQPKLTNLIPGLHGFHVHENPDCGSGKKDGKPEAGAAAGGHYDPKKTGKHAGPYGDGHLGDLPALFVNDKAEATHPVLAPRIKLADLKGRALVIHEGGDNYSEQPKLGGGGGRMACGVVK